MLAWIQELLVRWGLLSPPPALNAAAAMAELRASKRSPADSDDWDSMVRRFHTKVFSADDRKRVWRRYRRKYPGDLYEWDEIRHPNDKDEECLKQILDELAR